MDTASLTKLAIGAGIVYAAYRFGGAPVKAVALSVAALIVAKQVPYVNQLAA